MESLDLVIIGAGAAGLTAGIYAARSGLKTLIIEEKIAGGTVADAPVIENYPGFDKISGMELAQKMVFQCRGVGVVINELERVVSLHLNGDKKLIKTDKGEYSAKAIIIATGTARREVGVPGEREFMGRGVSYCGVCDGPLFKGKKVIVVGGGNSAVSTALYLAEIVSSVKIIHRREAFRAEEALVKALTEKNNVEVLFNTELKEIKGDKLVKSAVVHDRKKNEVYELPVDGIFIQVGEAPNSQLAREAGVEVDEHGYIKVDARQRTNIPGVYAAGDVTNHPFKQVAVAVGQGATAALEAYGYVKRPYYYSQ